MNDADPPSPCTGVCWIHPDTGLCAGCARTLAEITDWSRLPTERKKEVIQAAAARKREKPAP